MKIPIFIPPASNYNKYALLMPTDPVQKRKWNTLNTVQQNNRKNGIYNKNEYAGKNDHYNSVMQLTRVRNAGFVVPKKSQMSPHHTVHIHDTFP